MGPRLRRLLKMLPGARMPLLNQTLAAGGSRGGGSPAREGGIVSGFLAHPNLMLHGVWLVIAVSLASLSFWAGLHAGGDRQIATPAPVMAAHARAARPAKVRSVTQTASNIRYVRRGGSVLRDKPKTSGHVLKKESKGAAVTFVAEESDGWTKVTDGNITGFMRSSVLRPDPPPPE